MRRIRPVIHTHTHTEGHSNSLAKCSTESTYVLCSFKQTLAAAQNNSIQKTGQQTAQRYQHFQYLAHVFAQYIYRTRI